jgi:PLP dependent protein
MIEHIRQRLSAYGATLVAVSKTQPPERIRAMYDHAGQRAFGENRVQEMVAKYEALPKDIEWHLIGHLQRNKVKYIAPFVALIHSVDSLELLVEIDRQAARCGRVIDCLLEFHVAQEDTKHGLSLLEAEQLVASATYAQLRHVRLCGVMGMATFTDDAAQVRREFDTLRGIFLTLKNQFFVEQAHFRHLSMGMSGDWERALEAGSTMVRIGSLLFAAPPDLP